MKELWDAVQWLWRNTTGGLRLVLIIVVCLVGLAWLALANSDKWKVIFKPIADARRRNKYKFLKDSLGILVLRIVADDKRDSLQAKLIAELNNALDDQSNIQVRGYKLVVDESIGLVQAHKLARDIGEKFNAFLVI